MSLLFLVCFDKTQEFSEVSSTPQKVSIPPTSFFWKRNLGGKSRHALVFFAVAASHTASTAIFRAWQPSASAQADPSLEGVDMCSCRGACRVEESRKTEIDTGGSAAGLLPQFIFEFSQPFLQKKRKNDIKTYRMVGLFCDF